MTALRKRILTPADFLTSAYDRGLIDPETWTVRVGEPVDSSTITSLVTKGGFLLRMKTLLELLPTSLVEAARQTLTEDNRYTRDPIWQVKVTRKVWGMDEDFSQEYRWVDQDSGDYFVAEGALHDFLEATAKLLDASSFGRAEHLPEYLKSVVREWEQDTERTLRITEALLSAQLVDAPEALKLAQEESWAGHWQKRYYVEQEELIATFFTEEAADLYIQQHGHRHRRGGELYTYVDTCMNQPQILLIRELLRALAVAEKQLQASNV